MPDNSFENIIAPADELYSKHEDIKNVWTSLHLLRSALDEVNNYEIAWRLGRAFFFLGQEEPAVEIKRELHAQGVDAGKRAVRAEPARVEAHFWLGVNLALLAQVESPLKAIAHALQAKRALQQAVMIDPSYHAAGPLRALARLRHKLPRLLGGGSAQARENYERAIELAPNNTVTRIYFAELLSEIGDNNRARAEFEAVINAPFDPAWSFEIERDRKIARELLKNN